MGGMLLESGQEFTGRWTCDGCDDPPHYLRMRAHAPAREGHWHTYCTPRAYTPLMFELVTSVTSSQALATEREPATAMLDF